MDRETLYNSLVALLRDIKLTLGPSGLDATLRRHKDIREFLKSYQTDEIQALESQLL